MEPKVLQDFFEKQHRKFKERAHAILQITHGHHSAPFDPSEWQKQRDEANAIPSHPLGVAPPTSGNTKLDDK